MKEWVYSLHPEGRVVIQLKGDMDREEFDIFKDWMALVMRQIEKDIKEKEPRHEPASS